jgi:hypothetical protein
MMGFPMLFACCSTGYGSSQQGNLDILVNSYDFLFWGCMGRPGRGKRTDFQRAEDRKLAVEMLQTGATYGQIAEEIGKIRPYSISYQQVIKDLDGLRQQAIAHSKVHIIEVIDTEIQELENIIAIAKEEIEKREPTVTTIEEPKKTTIKKTTHNLNAGLLKIIADATARRSALLGLDAHIKYQDINAAIEAVTSKGYIVTLPDGDNE